jgi:hypothetical protein
VKGKDKAGQEIVAYHEVEDSTGCRRLIRLDDAGSPKSVQVCLAPGRVERDELQLATIRVQVQIVHNQGVLGALGKRIPDHAVEPSCVVCRVRHTGRGPQSVAIDRIPVPAQLAREAQIPVARVIVRELQPEVFRREADDGVYSHGLSVIPALACVSFRWPREDWDRCHVTGEEEGVSFHYQSKWREKNRLRLTRPEKELQGCLTTRYRKGTMEDRTGIEIVPTWQRRMLST